MAGSYSNAGSTRPIIQGLTYSPEAGSRRSITTPNINPRSLPIQQLIRVTMQTTNETVNMMLEQASKLSFDCLRHNGCDVANAEAVTNRMIDAEADKCHSHGLFRLPWYVTGMRSGRANGEAKPVVEQLAPAVIRVDGDNGYAPLGQQLAHNPLVACTRKNGIAALAFVNMYHIAAMWPEVEKLALDGLCAFAFTASYPYVAPAGESDHCSALTPWALPGRVRTDRHWFLIRRLQLWREEKFRSLPETDTVCRKLPVSVRAVKLRLIRMLF